ncbi:cytochrome bd oxidase small subunit CydS [Paenibacillus selenitireducens]
MEIFLLFCAPFLILFCAIFVLFWWGTIAKEDHT